MNEDNAGERRYAVLAFSAEALMRMAGGTFRVTTGALPPDAQLDSCYCDPMRGEVCLVVTSGTFAPVSQEDKFPRLQTPSIEVLTEEVAR